MKIYIKTLWAGNVKEAVWKDKISTSSTTALLDESQLSKCTSKESSSSKVLVLFALKLKCTQEARDAQEQLLCSSFNGSVNAAPEIFPQLPQRCHSYRESVCRLQVCVFVDHLPFSAVLQSVAYLIFGLKQDVLELGGAGPADRQLVLEVADTTHLHVGRRVSGHCTNKDKC